MDALTQLRETASRIRHFDRGRDVREVFADWRDAIIGTPQKKERLLKITKYGLPPVVLVLALVGWLAFRPVPQPDYTTADMASIFNFTFLTREFNRLPVEERVELLAQLRERMSSMSASESAVVAAFAASVAGRAREQLEENTSRLMIDLWDKYAIDYARLGTEDREAFLDSAMLELAKMGETLGGRTRDISDTERLAEIQRQSRRDREMMRDGQGPPPQAMGRVFTYVRDNIGTRASPAQRARAQQLMVDMNRRARGEAIDGRR